MTSPPLPTPDEVLLLKAALMPGGAGKDAWFEWRSRTAERATDEAYSWLFPLLYQALIQNGVAESEIPEQRAVYRATRARNQTLLGVARQLAHEFEVASIPFMFLKGIALLGTRYRDVGVRMMSDVDVLVSEEAFSRAVDLLRSNGWETFIYGKRVRRIDTRFTHAFQFFHPPLLSIDLHCRPLRELGEAGIAGFPWDAAVETVVGDLRIRVPCPADLLIITCVHGSRPRPKRDLRWIADAYVICAGPLDWERVEQTAISHGMAGLLVRPLTLLRDTFAVAIPQALLDRLSQAGTDPRVAAIHEFLEARSALMRLRSHPAMLALSSLRDRSWAARGSAYLKFWCQVESSWGIPAALLTKAARRVAFALGLFDYEAPIKRFLRGGR